MKANINQGWVAPFTLRLRDFGSLFRQWWLEELQFLLSNPIGRWLLGPGQKTLLLEPTTHTINIVLEGSDHEHIESIHVGMADYSRNTLDVFLQSRKLTSNDVDIILRLPFDNFFCRKLLLPIEAIRGLDEITERDLAKKTPFRLSDVFHHYVVERGPSFEKITIWQWIIKRQFVHDTLSQLQLSIGDVTRIESKNPSDQTPSPSIILQHGSRREKAWVWKSLRKLLLSLVILCILALGIKLWRQQSTIDELDAQIASARPKAQLVRAKIDRYEKDQTAIIRLRTEKSAPPGLLDILEQISATLPSHSWLTDLQFSQSGPNAAERQISLTGFSEAAASLVSIFDQTLMFREVSLTSPVSVDPVESRERFSMQMKVRNAAQGRMGTP